MFLLLKNSFNDFKLTYKKHLTFALIFMMLTSILFVPISSFIFNRLLLVLGTPAIVNYEVYNIALSYVGLASLFAIGLVAIIILFIQLGVIISIAQQKYFGKDILISDAILTTLTKTPKLIGFSLIPFMILYLIIQPFFNSPLTSFIFDFNVPIFVSENLSMFLITVYLAIIILAIYVLIRLVFTIHFIIIERKSIRKAIKESLILTKRNKMTILLSLVGLNVLMFLLSATIIYLISLIPSVITGVIGDLIDYYLVTFSSFIALAFTLLLIPINMIILTRLFYQFKARKQDDIEDTLAVVKSKRLGRGEKRVNQFFHKRRYLLIGILVAYVTGMFALNHNVNENLVYLKWNVDIAAHRGDSANAPENSLSAVESAIEMGVGHVEVDVQITKDGVAVLNHDLNLLRMAGVPDRVKDLTYDELQELEIGSAFSEEFAGEKIPKLEDALALAKEAEINLFLDLKPDGTVEELAREVARLIEEYEMEENVYAMAFEYEMLQEIRRINDEVQVGQLMFTAVGNVSNLDVDFYTIHQTMLSSDFVSEARELDREVWVWAVSNRTANQVLQYDINGIITKNPERFLQMLEVSE
ncbi:glycerophosphoryl diester phosphodiesterase membrane domain-containing protein [Alkalibacillus aidingensis]|uniref:glycerophosphoryl diester phosphodiesterase membrane domain-containing protein n=1 Tax=Alkalibacillus aidingensis TaxID=2747607 RepID=UPI001660C011|nr:glycerophosphoryl diester phosphodiesterase membrane domain-containing protein [Alkalibacillus aidingensis]